MEYEEKYILCSMQRGMETSMQDSAEGYGEEYEGECGADDVSL